MPTPTKTFTILSNEKKSHRTKSELNQRKQGEKSLATGVAMKEHSEVKNNEMAHKEFQRINKLLKNIGKNDAIYEGVINRYCIIVAECERFEKMKSAIENNIEELEDRRDENEIDYVEYLEHKDKMQSKIISCDKQLQAKRKMLFDIEKENIMTIASALRSIPKKQESRTSELMKALGGSG